MTQLSSSGSARRSLAHDAVTGLVLLACLISLSLILNDRYSFGAPSAAAAAQEPPAPAVKPNDHAAADAADAERKKRDKYRLVGAYLARRYNVSAAAATDIVAKVHAIAQKLDLDPALILAVISVESRFNPIAESTMGAQGLMQVIPRFHPEKFRVVGGETLAFEPDVNILVGARILKQYLRFTGDLADALEMYAGASQADDTAYSTKVTRERDRLTALLTRGSARRPPL